MRNRSLFAAATALVLAAAAGQPTLSTHALHKRTLSVSIVGPTSVKRNDCNIWYASVSGGTPPYTFEWEGFDYAVLDNTGQSVMGGFYGIGVRTFGVTVSDANEDVVYAGSAVSMTSGGAGEPC